MCLSLCLYVCVCVCVSVCLYMCVCLTHYDTGKAVLFMVYCWYERRKLLVRNEYTEGTLYSRNKEDVSATIYIIIHM